MTIGGPPYRGQQKGRRYVGRNAQHAKRQANTAPVPRGARPATWCGLANPVRDPRGQWSRCGLVIWRIESWRIDEALYFTFVTGLTIGYGDFTPKHVSARLLSVVIGFAGIVLTGLVAAVSVQALQRDGPR